jgi:hypothetical protein
MLQKLRCLASEAEVLSFRSWGSFRSCIAPEVEKASEASNE